MPNRDYAARTKPKKNGNKFLILTIIFLLLLLSVLGLWVLSNMQPPQTQTASTKVQVEQKTKTALPSRPEEIYSYIRDLETREVPVDPNSTLARLSKEQEQQILRQKEEEKRRLEQQAQAAQGIQSTHETSANVNEAQLAEQKAQEQKLAEEKRKQELARKAEQERLEALKQMQDRQPAKVVAVAKNTADAPKSAGKFGLQCGAFKNRAQAENMQARLAMAGYNARINSNGEWNRVVVGPVGDRAAASAAQSNARSVAECLIISM